MNLKSRQPPGCGCAENLAEKPDRTGLLNTNEDDEPIKDVIAVGLQNLVGGNKNPLSKYNKAFRNLQARRRRKPVIPGSAKEKTAATETPNPAYLEVNSNAAIHTQVPPSQRQVDASESGARMAVARDDIDKEAEDTVDKDEIEPEMSFFINQEVVKLSKPLLQ